MQATPPSSSSSVASGPDGSRSEARISRPNEDAVTQIRAVTLDAWTACSWTQRGVQIDGLAPLQVAQVRTRNSTYEVAVAGDRAGDVFVRGGRYFPEWTRVQLAGASLGGACLKRHGIYIGFCVEFYSSGRRVVTSRVRSIIREGAPVSELVASSAPN